MSTDHRMLIGLMVLAGCLHAPSQRYPLPEATQERLGEIGVVARPLQEDDALLLPQSGRLAEVARGALHGSAMGTGYAARFSLERMGTPALGFIGFPIGLVGGTVHGAVAWESSREADLALRGVVAELELDRALPNQVAAFAGSHGYDVTPVLVAPDDPRVHRSRVASARRNGVDTLIEIRDVTIALYPAQFLVHPRRRLEIAAQIRLIRTADEVVLDDRSMIDGFGPALSIDEWTADHGVRFGEEVRRAGDRMVERIVTDYFMLTPFPERVFSDGQFDVYLRGLRPYEPPERARAPDGGSRRLPLEFRVVAQQVDSLRPTMRWEAFDGADVTYDLQIWRSDELGIDALVYSRTNLVEPTHTLETALEPASAYFWSVRAHYSEDGRDRITAWSRRTLKFALPLKILMSVGTLGIAALAPAILYDTFYVFTTP